MSFTFCTINDAINKAGANANLSISGAFSAWSDEAESVICDIAGTNLLTDYASLTANGKEILKALSSNMIAQHIIGYEPAAVGAGEASLRLNVLENAIDRDIKLLKEDKVKTYLGAT